MRTSVLLSLQCAAAALQMPELKEELARRGIKTYWKHRKHDLVTMLLERVTREAAAQASAAPLDTMPQSSTTQLDDDTAALLSDLSDDPIDELSQAANGNGHVPGTHAESVTDLLSAAASTGADGADARAPDDQGTVNSADENVSTASERSRHDESSAAAANGADARAPDDQAGAASVDEDRSAASERSRHDDGAAAAAPTGADANAFGATAVGQGGAEHRAHSLSQHIREDSSAEPADVEQTADGLLQAGNGTLYAAPVSSTLKIYRLLCEDPEMQARCQSSPEPRLIDDRVCIDALPEAKMQQLQHMQQQTCVARLCRCKSCSPACTRCRSGFWALRAWWLALRTQLALQCAATTTSGCSIVAKTHSGRSWRR